MKYLDITALDSINMFLNHLNLGAYTIRGNLEAFSCKHTRTDKKMSTSLGTEIYEHLKKSLEENSPSPLAHLSRESDRKAHIYFVLTLSNIYPDHDFSGLETLGSFVESGWQDIVQTFDTFLYEAARRWATENDGNSMMESTKKAIAEVINLEKCIIYGYDPGFDKDPAVESGTLWSFCFFLYDKDLRRVVSFRCHANSNPGDGSIADSDSENEDVLEDMEL